MKLHSRHNGVTLISDAARDASCAQLRVCSCATCRRAALPLDFAASVLIFSTPLFYTHPNPTGF